MFANNFFAGKVFADKRLVHNDNLSMLSTLIGQEGTTVQQGNLHSIEEIRIDKTHCRIQPIPLSKRRMLLNAECIVAMMALTRKPGGQRSSPNAGQATYATQELFVEICHLSMLAITNLWQKEIHRQHIARRAAQINGTQTAVAFQ